MPRKPSPGNAPALDKTRVRKYIVPEFGELTMREVTMRRTVDPSINVVSTLLMTVVPARAE